MADQEGQDYERAETGLREGVADYLTGNTGLTISHSLWRILEQHLDHTLATHEYENGDRTVECRDCPGILATVE